MDVSGSQTLKRTFEDSGLGDDPVENTSITPGKKGYKLVQLTQNVRPDGRGVSLDSLPTEILSHIASNLSTSDLLSLRLTSRTIEVQLFNDFAAYYFAKKQFMLTTESLQCLLDISLHPKLSTVLEHVIISLDRFALDLALSNFRTGDTAITLARSTKYRQGAYDQAILLATGQDREILTQAFRNLRNLKTVGLRDYNSGKKWRDGESAEWRAYGATTVLRETGMNLLESDARFVPQHYSVNYAGAGTANAFAARAFAVILQSLGSSGATPSSVEILLRDKQHGLPDYAFNVTKSLEPVVARLLEGLKVLLLGVDLNRYTVFSGATIGDMEPEAPDFALQHFLSFVPNVTHLRLNFQNHDPTGNVAWFLKRFASADTHMQTQLLPNLAQLEFGMMLNAEPSQLTRVVGRWGNTLTGVTFWKVSIKDSDDQESALRLDSQAKPNRWAELLSRLPDVAPKLRRITVGCVAQYCRQRVQHVTLNVGSEKEHSRPALWREYRREEMVDLKKFRRLLDEELQVSWRDFSSGHSVQGG